jgi:small subunit ribosomal protein S6
LAHAPFLPHSGFSRQATMTQPYYETMYILRPDIPEEEVETHVNKYRDIVLEAGGEVLDCQMRGKRRLAYPIAKHREGIYVQLSHNGDGQQVAPLERAMRISEDVIRYLTVKQDGPLPAPRAVPTSGAESAAAAEPAGV